MSPKAPGAADLLLEGDEPGTALDYAAPPPRRESLVTPLVDGSKAFPAMEEAIAAAKESVWIAAWIFNARMPVQAGSVRRGGTKSWGDLLAAAAGRGVDVRVLLTDFDPLLARPLHMTIWRAYLALVRLAPSGGGLEVVPTRHEATASAGIEDRLSKRLDALVRALNTKKGIDTALLSTVPGAWPFLALNAKRKRIERRADADLSARPATHHQKMCVVDGRIGFCGGLDPQLGRLDTRKHDGDGAWHDLHCKVEGPVVQDLARNFALRWNAEHPQFVAFRAEANARRLGVSIPVQTPGKPLAVPAATKGAGKSVAQAHRTLSEQDWTPYPETEVDDIERAYRRAIERAEKFVYLENQYFRSEDLAGWLAARAKAVPELQIIVVLPVAPEEVGLKGGADEITLHGLFLQSKVLKELRKLGGRFGVFSLVKPVKGGGATASFGSPQLYVHSKCLIVDDLVASIGSANANPRSFTTDTELNVSWYDPAEVTRFRVDLWTELLGAPAGLATWKPADFVAKWTAIASANERAAANRRSGFVVRHDETRFPGTEDSRLTRFAGRFDPETGDDEVA